MTNFGSSLIGTFTNFTPIFDPTSKNPTSVMVSGDLTSALMNQLSSPGKPSVERIEKALARFPELSYHLSALASFVSYTNQYPWVNKRVYGPGGISVTVTPTLNTEDRLADMLQKTLSEIKDIDLTNSTLLKDINAMISNNINTERVKSQTEADIRLIKELSYSLLRRNDIYAQLYKAANSLLTYGHCIVDYKDDGMTISFFSLEEIKRRTKGNTEKEEWYIEETGEVLSEQAKLISDSKRLKHSPMSRVLHYLNVLDVLETNLSVERLSKNNSFVVWKVGVDGIPGESVPSWIDVYKQRVMSRIEAGTQNGNITQAAMSKSITASHIFIPNYQKSPTEVSAVNMEYRPWLDDLQYWWSKVFMAIGIPPYYAPFAQATSQPSGDTSSFHESQLGNRIRRIQGILENSLVEWLNFFLNKRFESNASRYTISVNLPTYVSGGEEARSEYMKRVNQFASAYSTLKVSGLPLDPEFSAKLMFPNSDPDEVLDRRSMSINEINTSDDSDPADDEEVDSVLNALYRGGSASEDNDQLEIERDQE